MAEGINATFDVSGILAGLDKLSDAAYSLGRRMSVSGARVLRDEAKINAPGSSPPYNPISRGSQAPGTLKNALYVAFNERLSSSAVITYSVSWNRREAWYGHLAEFGWWQKYAIEWVPGHDYFVTVKSRPLPEPIYHPGTKFLSRSYESAIGRAREAMLERGRAELPILLAEGAK